jgi:hypothetical protein
MKASLRTHLQQSSELDSVANLLSCASLAFFIAPEVFYDNYMQLAVYCYSVQVGAIVIVSAIDGYLVPRD